jgi:hypothetical protein
VFPMRFRREPEIQAGFGKIERGIDSGREP